MTSKRSDGYSRASPRDSKATSARLCDQAIWMDHGVLRMWDEPEAVIDAYTEFLEVGQDAVTLEDV